MNVDGMRLSTSVSECVRLCADVYNIVYMSLKLV